MALFNYATKEITLKIVYYGPGLSGKTTNLQHLHAILDPAQRGKLLSLSTEADRTLFFDFMPVELGKIRDFSIRFQLYTVPGQVRYNATRRLVLKGADAVVFVADSQKEMLEENVESLKNMHENLIANNLDPDEIPLVIQYNKRDLPNILSIDELNNRLNLERVPYFEAVAIEGKGVKETFEAITKLLLKHISKKHKIDIKTEETFQTVRAESEKIPVSRTEKLEPSAPSFGETTARRTSFSTAAQAPPSSPALSDDVTKLLKGISKQIGELQKSSDSKGELRKTIQHLTSTIERFNKNLTDSIEKQNEIISLLKEIKSSIDNAKTKKKWLFFG